MRFLCGSSNALRRQISPLGALFALALSINFAPFGWGQNFTSSIGGIIKDPSGALVSTAKVELKNEGTNDVRDAQTGSDGTYQFNNLNPGTYSITATAPGFKSYVRSHLILEAATNSSINVALQVGSAQQSVQVTGSQVLVDTETANNTITLDHQLMEALPNATRNPLNFVFAVAGTTTAPAGSGQTQTAGTFDQMSSNFGLNGGRTGEASILIDGAPSQAVDWGGLMVSPLQDSVQEQQIIQNTYDAQFERGGEGIVSLITRGGTNTFHGEVYDYLQNSALNANSWYNNTYGFPKGQFKQNQFGGNISGPLLKRANLYFFGGYEGLRQPNTQSTLTTVPTLAERNGNFSAAQNADGSPDLIYNPFTTTTSGTAVSGFTRSQFPGNVIPASLINPVGQKIVNLYPLPNRAGTGPNDLNNFAAQGAGNYPNDKSDTRIDWEQSPIHRLFVRWSDRYRQDQTVPCYFCNGADTGVNQSNHGFQVVVNDTVTPNPTWVINTYISYSRWVEEHTAQGYGEANASTIGLSPSLFQAPVLPVISADNGYSSIGNGTYERFARNSDTAEINLTKTFQRHTLKFGANFDNQQINVINEAAGNFSFSSAQTSCDPNPAGDCTALNYGSTASGNSIASMLLGTGSGGSQGLNLDPAESLHTYGAYIQDQWRVTQRLTLNAGVRYDNQRPATERLNQLTYFDTTVVNPVSNEISPAYGETLSQVYGHPIYGGLEYTGQDGNSRYQWSPNNHDFAPRAGLAYKLTDKLVIRAGAGIFFLPPSAMIGDDAGQSIGYSSTTSYNPTNNSGYTPVNLISNPFPTGLNSPTGSSSGLYTDLGDGISYGQGVWLKGNHPTPYTENWSFNLQYQIGAHSVFEVGYNGNRGKKLLYGNISLDADQLPGQYLSLGNQLNQQVPNPFYGVQGVDPNGYFGTSPTIPYNYLLRPYPQYWALVQTRSLPGGRSAFDALDVKYTHQFSSGLSLLSTYQWSKAMDNAPEDYLGWATGTQWRDAYNTNLDYNISTHDIPQSFGTALVYDLPYGRGKQWGDHAPAVVKEVLGNWQVSSVIRLTSGLPLFGLEESPNNILGDYGFPGPVLPNLVSKNVVPTNQSADNWINAAAYATPASQYIIGNAPQRMTQLRTRAARNVDLSVGKNLGGERYQVWLRGEALNLFNYAQYSNFCLDLSQSSCPVFGMAQNTENGPRTIQVSLKVSF